MSALIDAAERRRALTALDETLLVEAAAGTGKTALIAGRVTMLLAAGVAPKNIAAITFTEFAASELSGRVSLFVDELVAGHMPDELKLAFPDGLSSAQREALGAAALQIDELTATTVHAFCQTIIITHAIEAGIDPGVRVLEAAGAKSTFDAVFDAWLEARLSGTRREGDIIAYLAEEDPRGVEKTLRKFARLMFYNRTATVPSPAAGIRPDLDFARSVAGLRAWHDAGSADPEADALIQHMEKLAARIGEPFAGASDFAQLWRLSDLTNVVFPQPDAFDDGAPSPRRVELEKRWSAVADDYRRLVNHIAGTVMWLLGQELESVRTAYANHKRGAALVDFDDLQLFARKLVRENDAVRRAVGARFKYVLVDEFQDTDPIQAEVFFRIGAQTDAPDWTESRQRPGALFMVGDPKQAIYAFRGADVTTYEKARTALAARWPANIISIKANFRSRPGVIEYVNACFAGVFNGEDQPLYVALEPTRVAVDHGLPAAARMTVAMPDKTNARILRRTEASAVADLCKRLIDGYPLKGRTARPGDIALLAPQHTQLWHYEEALAAAGLPFISQAGKGLFKRQETQDFLALVRTLADRNDSLAFGALMRGPLVGLTEEVMLDIAGDQPDEPGRARFSLFTDPSTVAHDGAREVLQTLRDLRGRASSTTPLLILTEALERLNARAVLAQRGDARGARAWSNMETLLERARGYGVSGLRRFAHDLDRDWQAADNTEEGRPDAEGEAIHIVTMYKAKGLEWPIVIPINATSLPWSPPDFVHRQRDDTLHWVINGIRSPELGASLGADSNAKARERARVWYVTCTRAKELLIVPNIVEADKRSWFGAANLDLEQKLPEWDLDVFAPTGWAEESEPDNTQTGADFEREQSAMQAKSVPVRWRIPSAGDFDRAPLAELIAAEIADAPTAALIIGAGRLRGLVLHKLMEEVLTGETEDSLSVLTARADQLTAELAAQFGVPKALPSAQEMAATILQTLALPEVADVRAKLQPEVALYAHLGPHELLAGRADAIAFADDRVELVFDWKSDVAPDEPTIADHASQLRAYLVATSATRGGLVYMTTGAVRWVTRDRPDV